MLLDMRPGCSVSLEKVSDPPHIRDIKWYRPTVYTQEEFEKLEDTSNLIYNQEVGLYTISPFTIPTQEECETYWNTTYRVKKYTEILKRKRNQLLYRSDVYALPDFPHPTPEIRQAWLVYRQSLRDLPELTVDPEYPIWPTPPS